jgi:hypothetical protein
VCRYCIEWIEHTACMCPVHLHAGLNEYHLTPRLIGLRVTAIQQRTFRISHVAKYLLTISLTTARISGMPYVTMAPQLE